MKPAYSKKPTEVGLLACGEQGLLTSAGGYVTVEVRSRTGGKILTTAKILRKCKNMAQPHLFLTRRSFYAVGQSCDTNLIPPETRNYGHCEVSPTYEGGINSVNVTNCRIRQGAVLPAGTKWLLITGLMERVLLVGGHEQPSLDGLWDLAKREVSI